MRLLANFEKTNIFFIRVCAIIVLVLISWNNYVWAGKVKLYVRSSPTAGGYVYANTEDKNNIGTLTSDDATSKYKVGGTVTMYRYAKSAAGYTFVGWADSDGGTPSSTASSVSLAAATGTSQREYTYYAIFKKTYTIVFHGNGETSGSMSNLSMVYDTGKELTNNSFTREYIVSYNANGGSCSTNSTNTTATYSFAGWEDRNSIVYNSTTYAYTTFDAPYYANTYSDLKAAFGYNKYNLIQHYVNNGINEGRSCKGSSAGLYPNTALVNNLTTTAGGTVNLYAHWNSASVTLPTATQTGKVLDGWYSGNTKIGEPGDSYTPTANITLTAKWSDKLDFDMSGADTHIMVDATQTPAFTFTARHYENPIAHISDTNIITYDATSNTITAHKAGVATIYFTQNETGTIKSGTSATYTYTVHKYNSTFSNVNALVVKVDTNVTSSYTLTYTKPNVSCLGIDNISSGIPTLDSTSGDYYYTLANNVTTGITSGSPDNSIAITYNATTKTATGKNQGSGTIHLYQKETSKYNAADTAFSVTVSKNSATITPTYSASMYFDRGQEITITSTNIDYANSPITITQTAGTNIASYYNGTTPAPVNYTGTGQQYIYTSHNLGTATWYLTQPENYKYNSTSTTITVTTATAAEATNCYLLDAPDEHSYGKYGDSEHKQWQEFSWSGMPKELKFKMWKHSKANDIGNHVYVYDADGNELANHEYAIASISTSAQDYTVQLPENARKVKFQNGAGTYAGSSTLSTYVSNILVTRKTYLTVPNITITKQADGNTDIFPDAEGKGTLAVNYSLANGGPLKIYCDNSHFTFTNNRTNATSNYVSLGDLGCSGSTLNIPVYYNATAVGTENANLIIYNNVYRTTATITATTQPRIQSITWKYTMLRLGTSVSDAASAHNLITYASSDTSIIRVDKDANGYKTILTPLAEGTATITATAAADAEYAQAVSSQSIKVTTKQIQTIVWNQNLFGLKLGGSNVPLKAYATSDVEDCTSNGARTITYTSSDTSVVSIVNGNNLKIEGVGRAIITATQAGTAEGFDDGDGHEYEAISAEKTAIVRDPNEPCNSYVYEQENEYRFELGWNAANKQTKTKEIDFNGIEPDICTFRYKGEAKTVAIEYYDGTMTVEQYLNGGWHEVRNLGKPLKSKYSNTTDKGIIQFDRNATKMRIKVKDGLGYQYFTDCQVTQARYIETTAPVAFAANVGQTITQDIYLSYSNITDNLNLSMGQGANSHFSVDRTFIEGTCGDHAKNVRLTISYYSDTEETDAEDNLIITDGTTTCRVALTATASRANRNITWNHADVTDIYTVQTETLSAEAYTNINILAGEVVFSIGGSSTASASISQENVLSFSSEGVVYVTANTREDARYNPAQYITKRWNVSTTPTSINVAPTAADITYGAAMGDIELSGGSAVNTVNGNTVEGSFSVVSADMSSYGPKTITVAFIPDNTAMYDSCHTTIPLMINKAVSVATPTAAAIDYGAAVSTSELSNTGTAGTWTWTDARQNEVLPADTYTGLSVHFTPDNSNYTELDATVELTVNAIMPDLAWITALTSFAYDATGIVYTAASNNSAGEITYSIVSGTCADIDSNSGALTIASAGYITVRATIAANGNYTAKYIDIDVHITSPNNFTNADGDGDWHNPNNWTSGSVPEESVPNVFVSGELEIDSSLTVGSLTIENTGSITVIRNCTLTVTGASDYREEYGDIVVSTGAVLDVTGKLKARDFTLTAAIGSRTVGAQSGQVLDPATLDIKGNAYFELALDPRGECSQGWYDFTVPFPVDATSGVSRWENGVLNNNLKYGTNYALMEFSEPTRATGAYPWKKFRGVMQPGICYTITIDDVHNVYRFKKTEQGAFNLSSFLTMTATSSAPLADRGWNGIGNGTLAHADLSAAGVDKVQLYDHITNSYSAVDINDYTYVVGSAFFAQVPSERPMNFNTPTNRTLRTPARADYRTEEYVIAVKREGQKHFDDRLYFSADESADNTYEIGHDLAKLGTFTEAASAQMWSTSYGMTLCDVELPLANDMAETPVSFFAPKAGDYTLYVEKAPEDGTSLYLVHNGIQVWNIGLEPYTLSLKKGVTTGYSLRIVASDIQHTPTDIQTSDADNVDTVLKYINNGCMYIQCGDRIYDSKGSVIK